MNSPQRVRYLNSISPRFMTILWFLTALLVSCVATNAQTALPTNQIEKVDRYVAIRVSEQRIPGAALAIVEQDHITRVTGFGVADPTGRRVTAETPFILGSLSKSSTIGIHPGGRRNRLDRADRVLGAPGSLQPNARLATAISFGTGTRKKPRRRRY